MISRCGIGQSKKLWFCFVKLVVSNLHFAINIFGPLWISFLCWIIKMIASLGGVRQLVNFWQPFFDTFSSLRFATHVNIAPLPTLELPWIFTYGCYRATAPVGLVEFRAIKDHLGDGYLTNFWLSSSFSVDRLEQNVIVSITRTEMTSVLRFLRNKDQTTKRRTV